MHKWNRTATVIVLLFVLISGSGCSFDFNSVESLMRAPKLTGDFAEIERAFEDAVGTSVALLSPRAGEYRTAFVLYDYDADGEDESIVFYTAASDETTVRMHFLDCIDGKWMSVDDEVGKEKDVHELIFRDLNNDSVPEIIVNFNTKQSNRTMFIYSVIPAEDGMLLSIQPMSSVQYTSYVCLDMDHDGSSEILYTVFEVSVDTGMSNPFVRVLKYIDDSQGDRIDMISSLSLYSGITSFEALAVDSSDDMVRVYIDCLYHDVDTMITEVISWTRQNGFVLLLHKHESASLLKTTRSSSLFTSDLDKDGIMEIPGEYEMPASIFENSAEGMIPVAIGRNYYHCSADGTLSLFKAEFLDPSGRYVMDLLNLGFYGRVCITYDCITEAASFYLYDAVQMERGERLFTLWFKEINSEPGAYFDISTMGAALGLTPETIRSTLTMLETEVK